MRVELSQSVKDICKENYKTNCGQCPIRPKCVSNNPVRTQEELNNYVKELNELAVEVLEEGQTDIFDYL